MHISRLRCRKLASQCLKPRSIAAKALAPATPYRSVVKIQGTGCYGGNTSASVLAAVAWGSNSTTSNDSCVKQYTQFNATDAITAIAVDGFDNLWVSTDPVHVKH